MQTGLPESGELFPQTLFSIDRKGGLSFVRDEGCLVFGYQPQDLAGPVGALKFLAPGDRPRFKSDMREIMQGGAMAGGEYTALRKDGTTFPVVVSLSPVLADGRPVGLAGVMLDISAMGRSLQLLKKSEKRYRQLLETMNQGFAIVDPDRVLTYVNSRLCEMLGYASREVEGEKVEAFLNPANRKVLKKNYVKRRKGRADSYELAWTKKDGSQLATIMSPEPLYDDEGVFCGSYSVITDVTLLKHTEEALRQRERELESQATNLTETNAALKVLLKRREEDKRELEERIMANIRELVTPYIAKLKRSRLGDRQRIYLEILEGNLDDLTAPFVDSLMRSFQKLTPAEIRVAALVREGRTSKQIADILTISSRTVEFHRDSIRRKLGLARSKTNLRSFLLSLR